MRPMVRDFLTGLTAILSLVALLGMLMLFGELARAGERTYRFDVLVTNAGGLKPESRVTLNGVPIGRVLSASPEPTGARLTLAIERGISIPGNVRFALEKGFIGDAALDLTLDPGLAAAEPIQPGATINAGSIPGLLERLAEQVRGPLAKIESAADSITTLASEYTALGQRLNDLLASRTLAEVNNGAQPNLRTAIERLDRVLAGADTWLNDTALRERVASLLTRAETLADQAQSLTTEWTAAATTVRDQTARVGDTVDQLARDASEALARTEEAAAGVTTILDKVSRGEGTAGQLITNPELYDALNDAARRLDDALADVQQLIERFRTEGVPLRL